MWLRPISNNKAIHSFHTAFPLGRVARAVALGGLEIPHDQQQSQVVLLASHQDGTRRRWHSSKASHFSKIWLTVKILSAVPRPGRKPPWISSSFALFISLHLYSRHSVYTFSLKLRSRMSRQLVHSLLSPFLSMGITPIFQPFGVLPKHQTTWHTRVSQRTQKGNEKSKTPKGRILLHVAKNKGKDETNTLVEIGILQTGVNCIPKKQMFGE